MAETRAGHASEGVARLAAEKVNQALIAAASENAPKRLAKSRRVHVEVDAKSAPLQIEENPYEVMA